MGTGTFSGAVTGLASACLAIVALDGIESSMAACWSLATVVSAGLIALGLAPMHRPQK